MKIGIFYGSSTGNTAAAALKIADTLGVDKNHVYDVAKVDPAKVADYDLIILGSSTWGDGEMQDDWYDFIAAISAMYLKGKEIAIFGEGDVSMTDTFCDAVGEIYDKIKDTGARIIGNFNYDGYDFNASRAVKGDTAVGLLLDDMNYADLSDERITRWCTELKAEA